MTVVKLHKRIEMLEAKGGSSLRDLSRDELLARIEWLSVELARYGYAPPPGMSSEETTEWAASVQGELAAHRPDVIWRRSL